MEVVFLTGYVKSYVTEGPHATVLISPPRSSTQTTAQGSVNTGKTQSDSNDVKRSK